jgi:hypothetical protein
MSTEMFHIRHWKVYDAHYGDKTRLGSLLIQAQVRTLLRLCSNYQTIHIA